MAWTVTLTYDTDVLSLQSHAVDNIWGDATTTEEAGQLGLLMNCAANCDATNTAVTGQDIPILTATFRVSASAAVQSLASAISLRVNAMLNFGNNFIVEEANALVLDSRDGGGSSGTGYFGRIPLPPSVLPLALRRSRVTCEAVTGLG